LPKWQQNDLDLAVTALQQGDLDARAKSWLGNSANLPINEEHL